MQTQPDTDDAAAAAPHVTMSRHEEQLGDEERPEDDEAEEAMPMRWRARPAKRRRIVEDEDEDEGQADPDQRQEQGEETDMGSASAASVSAFVAAAAASAAVAVQADVAAAASGQVEGSLDRNVASPAASSTQSPEEARASSQSSRSRLGAKKARSSSSLAARSVAGVSECRDEVSSFARLLAAERSGRTGWIPSLTTRLPAAALDARETLFAAMAAAGGDENETARRRETQDTFLANLAAKYARPTQKPRVARAKAGEKEQASTGEASDAITVTAGSSRPRKKARAEAKPREYVPDDMTFLLLQEKLGWDKKLKK